MLRKRNNKRYNEETNDDKGEGGRTYNLKEKIRSPRFEQLRELQILPGEAVSLKLIQKDGFDKPILVETPAGLDLRVPPKSFSVRDVGKLVGQDRLIDVMDVKTQKNIEMTMRQWCKYYESRHRDRLLNVISLEFSHTDLDNLVDSPRIVKHLDWVDLVWPKFLKQSQTESTNTIDKMKYPKVQKYCLMSVRESYTDFHIDFGGTSVWYHILRGKKMFWMCPPTELNLQAFEEWTLSGMQQDVFFGDTVEECFTVELSAGNTFFIPSGWIHAVYTIEDSLVFGGNFLHSFGIENQLKVSRIEDATKVPLKFRYPFYTEILWYVVQHYVYCLTGNHHLHSNEITSDSQHDQDAAGSDEKISSQNPTHSLTCSNRDLKPEEPSKIHITKFELNGLKVLVKHLSKLSGAKKNLPALIRNSRALLDDCKKVILEHENDDPELAASNALISPASKSKVVKEPRPDAQLNDTQSHSRPISKAGSPEPPKNQSTKRTMNPADRPQNKDKLISASASNSLAQNNELQKDSHSNSSQSLAPQQQNSQRKNQKSDQSNSSASINQAGTPRENFSSPNTNKVEKPSNVNKQSPIKQEFNNKTIAEKMHVSILPVDATQSHAKPNKDRATQHNLEQHKPINSSQLQPQMICGLVAAPAAPGTNATLTPTTKMNPQQYLISRPLLLNSVPTYCKTQTALPILTTPVPTSIGLTGIQPGARIVWATRPPVSAMNTPATTNPTLITQSISQVESRPTESAPPLVQKQSDHAALLSLATTALSTAPLPTTPTLSQISAHGSTVSRALVVNPMLTGQPALFTNQQFFNPFLSRMPIVARPQLILGGPINQATPAVQAKLAAPRQTSQLLFAPLSSQTGQPRYLITQPGFLPERPQTSHLFLPHQTPATLAFATYRPPTASTSKPEPVKVKKVRTR